MSVLDAILTSAPVNKRAAVVTSQAGVSDGVLTPEQERENLAKKLRSLKEELHAAKGSPRGREIGHEILKVQHRITEVSPRRDRKLYGVEYFFMEVVRERVSVAEMRRFTDEAARRYRAKHGKPQ